MYLSSKNNTDMFSRVILSVIEDDHLFNALFSLFHILLGLLCHHQAELELSDL